MKETEIKTVNGFTTLSKEEFRHIKCSIYLFIIIVLFSFSSCVTIAHPRSYFPIKVLEGTVQMHIALIPTKSYSDVGRGYNDYDETLREYQKRFIPNSIPREERNSSSHIFFQDPRDTRYRKKSDRPAQKNEAAYFVEEITQGNELRWHIPRDFEIEVTMSNPHSETAICECSNKTFYLEPGKKKVLYFYN